MKPMFFMLGRVLVVAMMALPSACTEPVQEPTVDPAVNAAEHSAREAPIPAALTPGEAFFNPESDPNCIWTCENGTTGGANVSSELKCKQACKASCGPASACFLI